MAILRDRNGIFYEIPDRQLKKYAVPPKKVKEILKREQIGQGPVGPPIGPGWGAGIRPSTIIINLGPPGMGWGQEDTSETGQAAEVSAYSTSACWRRSCGCWRRSCSCKK